MAHLGAGAAAVLAGVHQNELGKLPVFSGDGKDTFTAEQWIERIEAGRRAAGWNDEATVSYMYNALRGPTQQWYESLPRRRLYVDDRANWDNIKADFLQIYATTKTTRTTTANLMVVQQPNERAGQFGCRVQVAVQDVITVNRPPVEVPAALHSPQLVALAGYAGLDDAVKRADFDNKVEIGFELAADLIQRNVFLTGLNPKIRQLVLSHEPVTFLEARDHAIRYERQQENPVKNIHISQVDEDELPEEEVNEAQLEKDFEGMIEKINRFRSKKGKPKFQVSQKNGGGGHKPNQGGNSAPRDPNVVCRYCNKKGHMQKNCFKRQRENGQMKDASGKPYRSLQETDVEPLGAAPHHPFRHLGAGEEIIMDRSCPQAPLNW